MTPYPHQRAALAAWLRRAQGVIVLPTGAGKTYLAQLVMQDTQQSTLIVVPTLDLMHQWYAHLLAAFPDAPVGLLGGGAHDRTPCWSPPMTAPPSRPKPSGTVTPC